MDDATYRLLYGAACFALIYGVGKLIERAARRPPRDGLARRFCLWRAEHWERESELHARAAAVAYTRFDREAFEDFNGYRMACSERAYRWRWRAARYV